MKLLLDTHALIWAMHGNPQLSRTAHDAIASKTNEGFVSVVSVWEAATKFRNGKLPEAALLAHNPAMVMNRMSLAPLPLSLEHARLAGTLVNPHKDPFDRMLAAQALLEGLTLVSRDTVFDPMLITRLW